MHRYIVTIEGPGFTDMEEVELPRLPAEGQPLETKYGTSVVTATQLLPENEQFDGEIACRLL